MGKPALDEVKEEIRQHVYGKNGPGNADIALSKVRELADQPAITHRNFEVCLLTLTQSAAEDLLRGLKKAFGNQQKRLENTARMLYIDVS